MKNKVAPLDSRHMLKIYLETDAKVTLYRIQLVIKQLGFPKIFIVFRIN